MIHRYVQNVYAMFKRKGLGDKYEHPGIYCILLDEQLVYIGKSNNMLLRIAEHYVGIKNETEKKYRILAEAQRKGHTVGFDVLYYAESQSKWDIEEEIGAKEGELIREWLPALNTQIPKKEDWHRWKVRQIDAQEVLEKYL